MTVENLETLKYPIGKFIKPNIISNEIINEWIHDLEKFPNAIEQLTKNLTTEQLNWLYRPDGWSIKQVVHHCADSHMNCLIRFKLSLTENAPTIKPYYEDRWATLIDYTDDDLSASLSIIKGIHAKLVKLIRHLSPEDLQREFIHPEHNEYIKLNENIGIYAWHSNHHLAHINQALKNERRYK